MTTAMVPRLLVVEDEPEILAEVVGYLRRRGELVVTASSYDEAARILSDDSQRIDLLISDGRMPGGSGIDLIRTALRRSGTQCRCILMTGHIEQSESGEDLQAAGVKFIYKPFSLSAFYREVRAAIAEAGRSGRSTSPALGERAHATQSGHGVDQAA